MSSISLADTLRDLTQIQEEKRIMDEHVVREYVGPFNDHMDKDSPEYAIYEFLNAWKTRNFGRMADLSVNNSKHSISKQAGHLRQIEECVKLEDFDLLSVRTTTIARADSVASLKGSTFTNELSGEFKIIAFRLTSEGDIAMPGEPGAWKVQEFCMNDLMNENTYDEKSR